MTNNFATDPSVFSKSGSAAPIQHHIHTHIQSSRVGVTSTFEMLCELYPSLVAELFFFDFIPRYCGHIPKIAAENKFGGTYGMMCDGDDEVNLDPFLSPNSSQHIFLQRHYAVVFAVFRRS